MLGRRDRENEEKVGGEIKKGNESQWTLPTTAFAESVNMFHCRDIYKERRHAVVPPK